MGNCQNVIVEAGVDSFNLNPGKDVSNYVNFPVDVAEGAAVIGYCREMTLLSGRPGILDFRESMHKRLVVRVDGERNTF